MDSDLHQLILCIHLRILENVLFFLLNTISLKTQPPYFYFFSYRYITQNSYLNTALVLKALLHVYLGSQALLLSIKIELKTAKVLYNEGFYAVV